jgi:hypothetical protein
VFLQIGAGSEVVRPARAGLTEGAPREAAVPRPGVRWRWLIAASTASVYSIGNQLLTTVWDKGGPSGGRAS